VAPKPKKKEKPATDEVKIAYRLVYTDENMKSHEITEEEFKKLKLECPELTKLLLNPELLNEAPIKDRLIHEKWQNTAIQIIEALKKNKITKIFNEPVQWEKLNIPDYPIIIKHPMDFGTIRVT